MLHTDYPYLISSLIMLAALAWGAHLMPDQRRAALVSATLAAPYAFSSVLFVPDYWNPRRLFSFGAGIEDLIFSFAGGGLVWLLAARLSRPQPSAVLEVGRLLRRYLTLTGVFFIAVAVLCSVYDVDVMAAVVGVGSVLFVVLLVLRPDLARLAVVTGVAYCVGYTLFALGVFALWPDFVNQWNWDNLTGITVLTLPAEEVVWALIFASCWVLAMGYAFDARVPAGSERG